MMRRRSSRSRRRPAAAVSILLIVVPLVAVPRLARALVADAFGMQPLVTGAIEPAGSSLPGGRVPDSFALRSNGDSAGSPRAERADGRIASRSVPEPATVSLLGAGLLALVVAMGRRRRLR